MGLTPRAQPHTSHSPAPPSTGDVPYDTRGFVERPAAAVVVVARVAGVVGIA